MKFTGITRPLDGVGRIVIPKEIREMLGWDGTNQIEIYTTDTGVFLTKKSRVCFKCQATLDLVNFASHLFCRSCLREGALL